MPECLSVLQEGIETVIAHKLQRGEMISSGRADRPEVLRPAIAPFGQRAAIRSGGPPMEDVHVRQPWQESLQSCQAVGRLFAVRRLPERIDVGGVHFAEKTAGRLICV